MNGRYLSAMIAAGVVSGFFVSWQPEQRQMDEPTSSSVRQKNAATGAGTRKGEADEAVMEKRRQVKAELARLASFEMMREIDDAEFETREPRYRELFSRWNLDDAAIEQALEIILNRGRQQGVVFVKYLKEEGREGDGKELTMASQIEDALAEQQLVQLLGADRCRELSRLDALLDSERAASVRISED